MGRNGSIIVLSCERWEGPVSTPQKYNKITPEACEFLKRPDNQAKDICTL